MGNVPPLFHIATLKKGGEYDEKYCILPQGGAPKIAKLPYKCMA